MSGLPARRTATDERGGTRFAWLLLAFVVAVAAFDLTRYAGDVVDDTFISFRYARNWVDGNGPVFNPGERVEGYTNFSFVALTALLLRAGVDPEAGTKVASLLFAVLAVAATARIERLALVRPPPGPPLSLLLLLPLEAFAYWSVASFETMAFTALFCLALARLLREDEVGRGHASALLFVLLALTRPEGVFLFVACNAASFAVAAMRRSARTLLGRYLANAAIFAAGFAPYFVWRWVYYGMLLPNTFHAKVTGGWAQLQNGVRHLGEWSAAFPLLALALVAAPALILRRRERAPVAPAPVAVVEVVALAYLSYVVAVGGDFMPFFRFFVPFLPLACVVLAWLLATARDLDPGRRRVGTVALPVAVLVGAIASHATEQPYRAFVADRTARVGERVGRWLAGRLAANDLVAVNTAGAVPYFSGLPAIDMLGLTDAAIASRPIFIVSPGWAGHRKGWGAYVLGRRPRVILWYNSAGSREPFYLGDHELADDPLFRFFYRAKAATLPAARDEGSPLARFLGNPFEVEGSREGYSPDLGLKAVLHDRPLRHTVLFDWPVTVSYFEIDERDEALWPSASRPDVGKLLDEAVRRWRSEAPAPVDARRRAEVEALCERARRQIESGRRAEAKVLLSEAMRKNRAARSPLVYQYAANLAVLTGDLLAAVDAQKEALRLAPDNELYRRNLRHLLTVPFAEGSRPKGGAPS